MLIHQSIKKNLWFKVGSNAEFPKKWDKLISEACKHRWDIEFEFTFENYSSGSIRGLFFNWDSVSMRCFVSKIDKTPAFGRIPPFDSTMGFLH